ncbi:hypothetical protein [Paraflavitalea sp. CAU 1676]|uniref:hypothetical protein n=1 Tax=Paraflavitalea sp. CAU 1676 TaxID=3032598 RepID=UPI0023DA314F|nr:hypothetical protein [Paraflavitalea sp. CAU 1676]MDF2188214.1 hypothetical protein [Paraflavitalea sp. CAU 1676]
MQKFIMTNYFKIIMSISAFILSVSILIFAVKGNAAYAKGGEPKLPAPSNFYVVSDGSHAYSIQYNTGLGKWESKSLTKLR